MARIAPKTGRQDVAPEYRHIVDDVSDVFGSVRGPFGMMLHSPELAALVLPLVPFLREKSIVPPLLRMVGVLAAVRERKSRYVWAAQVRFGRGIGVREDLIALLRAGGDPAGLPEDESDLIDYARQLMRTNRVDQALFDRLNGRHGPQWMVEMTAAINFYTFLAGIANAFDVPAPEDGDKLPE